MKTNQSEQAKGPEEKYNYEYLTFAEEWRHIYCMDCYSKSQFIEKYPRTPIRDAETKLSDIAMAAIRHFELNGVIANIETHVNDFITGAQSQPGIKQWVSENGEQAFEQFPNLSEQLQYAACHWKVDMSTWNELLQEINKVCEIALSK